MPHHRAGATAVLLTLIPCAPLAQTSTQVWANFTFDWVKTHRVTIGVDAEPKVLVSAPAGDPGWATLDVTPSVEYSRGEWFDMVTEILVGQTKQKRLPVDASCRLPPTRLPVVVGSTDSLLRG